MIKLVIYTCFCGQKEMGDPEFHRQLGTGPEGGWAKAILDKYFKVTPNPRRLSYLRACAFTFFGVQDLTRSQEDIVKVTRSLTLPTIGYVSTRVDPVFLNGEPVWRSGASVQSMTCAVSFHAMSELSIFVDPTAVYVGSATVGGQLPPLILAFRQQLYLDWLLQWTVLKQDHWEDQFILPDYNSFFNVEDWLQGVNDTYPDLLFGGFQRKSALCILADKNWKLDEDANFARGWRQFREQKLDGLVRTFIDLVHIAVVRNVLYLEFCVHCCIARKTNVQSCVSPSPSKHGFFCIVFVEWFGRQIKKIQ